MRLALALVAMLVGPAFADDPIITPPARPAKAPHGKRQTAMPAPKIPGEPRVRPTYYPGSPDPTIAQHREGEYGGVEPGVAPTTPTRHKSPPKNTLNWVGFEAKDGGSTVFFQAAAAFEVAQHVEGSTLIATLSLPRLGANAWRQVDTRFFDNPLSGVIAKPKSNKIEVRFSFKTPADAKEASLRTATEADGQYYVYFQFPPGTHVDAPTTKTPEQ